MVQLLIVATLPILRPAVIKPRAKMTCRVIFVLFFICTLYNRNAGTEAVAISTTHERTIMVSIKPNVE